MKKNLIESSKGLFTKGQHLVNLNLDNYEDVESVLCTVTVNEIFIDDNCERCYRCKVVRLTREKESARYDITEENFTETQLINILNTFYKTVFQFNEGDEVRVEGLNTEITKRYIKNGVPTYEVRRIGSLTEKEIIMHLRDESPY